MLLIGARRAGGGPHGRPAGRVRPRAGFPRRARFRAAAGVLAAAAAVAVLFWGPPRLIEPVGSLMAGEALDGLIAQLRRYWPWTPLVSILVLVLESIVAPVPAWPVVAANAALFGLWGGLLVSWLGAMAGAAAAFGIARGLGRERMARWLKPEHLAKVDDLSHRHGFRILLLARLVPLTNLDLLSYVAGLSAVRFPTFLLASGLGMLPWVFLFTWFAHDLLRAQAYGVRLGLVAGSLALGYVGYLVVFGRKARPDQPAAGHQPAASPRKPGAR